MKKKAIAAFFALMLIVSLCAPTYAATKSNPVIPELSFTGTTANCFASASGSGQNISLTLKLWCGNSLVAMWIKSGTSFVQISKTCAVVSGNTYTLEASGTIGGAAISSVPVTATCP